MVKRATFQSTAYIYVIDTGTLVFLQKLAVIAKRSEAFSIRHEGTHHEKFVQSSRMSYILICIRVALVISGVQSILDIPAIDEIHAYGGSNHGLG